MSDTQLLPQDYWQGKVRALEARLAETERVVAELERDKAMLQAIGWELEAERDTLRHELDRLNADLEAGQTFLVPNALTDEQRAMWKEFYDEMEGATDEI